MKKYLVPTLTLAVLLGGSVSPALADSGSRIRDFFQKFRTERDDNREETDGEQRGRLQELRDDAASRSQELRLKLQQKQNEQRRNRLEAFWRNATGRLQRLIDREEKMSSKIAERLAKFAAAGKDVSRQEALLGVADTAIADAQVSLSGAIATLQSMRDEGKPLADIIAKARELHKDVVGNIRAAHSALIDVIVSTRGMSITPIPTP